MSEAENDQEHIEVIVYSKPSIPDRTKYILGESLDNPAIQIIEVAKKLEAMEVGLLAMPCITAHYFYQDITKNLKIPLINIFSELQTFLVKKKITRVGVMATEGTMKGMLFQRELGKVNIEVTVPSEENQKIVTSLIYDNIKANVPADLMQYEKVVNSFFEQGDEVVILGCTELSVINSYHKMPCRILDIMELLAKRSIELCGYSVKKEFQDLLDYKIGNCETNSKFCL